uniref:Uncharacterized protein n=1 Tax=Myoviridae sp. ctBtT5 TaxID=2825048 RepID=A0A8S5Q067_9CAUD|nr:MAG TPA: hypothetical protein [Myoviridae sp. ctBtT5]
MNKSIQTPAPKPNNIRSFDLICIESSEIILNLLQSESFKKFPMFLLSYISDKDLEKLSKGLCSESVFFESFWVMDYFGVGYQIFKFFHFLIVHLKAT